MTLCLNMIVKDEAHIIVDTLKKITDKIKFDYYIISDTGSIDNTCELIESFFTKRSIPGELFHDTWMDFGTNRSLALNHAFGKTDYLFIFDADDYIKGDINLDNLTLDSYMIKFGKDNAYSRKCLVKNNIKWKVVGVLHEYITADIKVSEGTIHGDYHVVSGRTSSRNKNPKKYLNDAKVLQQGYNSSVISGDNLHNRYVFYCANSYYDAEEHDLAIEWYLKTLVHHGWFDERYISCLKLFELYKLKGQTELGMYYLVKSYTFNANRVEGIFLLVQHYTISGDYNIAWNYYTLIKDFYQNGDFNLNSKLFANVMDYTFNLAYYMIIVCEHLKMYDICIKMYNIIFENCKIGPVPGQWWIDNLIFNLQFCKNDLVSEKMKIYLSVVNPSKILEPLGELEELEMVDLLVYTGFAKTPWNYTYSKSNAIGGSERAVIELTNNFPKELSIIICGDHIEETIGNIRYIHRFNLKGFQFKHVIVSRYVSFFTIFPKLKFDRLTLMAHDIHFMNNLTGCNKSPDTIMLENIDRLEECVC
jgi:hypothetical protein